MAMTAWYRRGTVSAGMYDWDFWCRRSPMAWCYGDAVYNDPRRDAAPTFQEFCENLLLREELEYDLCKGENYQAEHYGKTIGI